MIFSIREKDTQKALKITLYAIDKYSKEHNKYPAIGDIIVENEYYSKIYYYVKLLKIHKFIDYVKKGKKIIGVKIINKNWRNEFK